jgi:hypothetical protein
MVSFQAAIPMLRVFDEALARAFYVDHLGFSWDWESRPVPSDPLYCQVSRGALRLHLSAHYGDGTPGTHLFLPIEGIDELRSELQDRNAVFSRPGIEVVPWGRVLTVIDPFSNHLNFTEWRDPEG